MRSSRTPSSRGLDEYLLLSPIASDMLPEPPGKNHENPKVQGDIDMIPLSTSGLPRSQ